MARFYTRPCEKPHDLDRFVPSRDKSRANRGGLTVRLVVPRHHHRHPPWKRVFREFLFFKSVALPRMWRGNILREFVQGLDAGDRGSSSFLEGRIRLRCRAGRWHDDVSIYDEIAGPLGVRGPPDATRRCTWMDVRVCASTQAPSKHATSPGSPGVSQSRS